MASLEHLDREYSDIQKAASQKTLGWHGDARGGLNGVLNSGPRVGSAVVPLCTLASGGVAAYFYHEQKKLKAELKSIEDGKRARQKIRRMARGRNKTRATGPTGERKTTHPHAIVFRKKDFDEEDAKAWLASHGFKEGLIEETKTRLRFIQRDESDFERVRSKKIHPGVSIVSGPLRDE